MAKSLKHQIDESWIALPGLFTESDLQGVVGLEIHALPLVLLGDQVLYGVYVRDDVVVALLREVGERHSTEPPVS